MRVTSRGSHRNEENLSDVIFFKLVEINAVCYKLYFIVIEINFNCSLSVLMINDDATPPNVE